MPEVALGAWHTAQTLKAAWPNMPSGALGEDLLAASLHDCVAHLKSEGITVPEAGAVPAEYRLAQLFFARAEWATTATNDGDDGIVGTDGYNISINAFRKRARDLLGYKSLGIG